MSLLWLGYKRLCRLSCWLTTSNISQACMLWWSSLKSLLDKRGFLANSQWRPKPLSNIPWETEFCQPPSDLGSKSFPSWTLSKPWSRWHLIIAHEKHRGREPKQAVSELHTNRNQGINMNYFKLLNFVTQ